VKFEVVTAANFWDIVLCSPLEVDRRFVVALMMEAVSAFETSGNFYDFARRVIPEGSHLQLSYFWLLRCRQLQCAGNFTGMEETRIKRSILVRKLLGTIHMKGRE
jgi:hypothetical protein